MKVLGYLSRQEFLEAPLFWVPLPCPLWCKLALFRPGEVLELLGIAQVCHPSTLRSILPSYSFFYSRLFFSILASSIRLIPNSCQNNKECIWTTPPQLLSIRKFCGPCSLIFQRNSAIRVPFMPKESRQKRQLMAEATARIDNCIWISRLTHKERPLKVPQKSLYPVVTKSENG